MDDETRRRVKSFAKLLSLLLLLLAAGYWVAARSRKALHAQFGSPAAQGCNHGPRFVEVATDLAEMKGDLALDSRTGQLCKTWKWTPQTLPEAAHARYGELPLCEFLADSHTHSSDGTDTLRKTE